MIPSPKPTKRPSGMLGLTIVLAGQSISILASGMTGFALSIWVFQRTSSATSLGYHDHRIHPALPADHSAGWCAGGSLQAQAHDGFQRPGSRVGHHRHPHPAPYRQSSSLAFLCSQCHHRSGQRLSMASLLRCYYHDGAQRPIRPRQWLDVPRSGRIANRFSVIGRCLATLSSYSSPTFSLAFPTACMSPWFSCAAATTA